MDNNYNFDDDFDDSEFDENSWVETCNDWIGDDLLEGLEGCFSIRMDWQGHTPEQDALVKEMASELAFAARELIPVIAAKVASRKKKN